MIRLYHGIYQEAKEVSSMAGGKFVQVHLDEDTNRRFSVYCINTGKQKNEALKEAIELLISHGDVALTHPEPTKEKHHV
jgi:hypothetical protein